MSSDFIFRAANHHFPGCGKPPCIDEPPRDANVFRSYFETPCGEQWILLHDAASDAITVHSGDCGWENALSVKPFEDALAALPEKHRITMFEIANMNGSLKSPAVCGKDGPVILGTAEQKWLLACLDVIKLRREVSALSAKKRSA